MAELRIKNKTFAFIKEDIDETTSMKKLSKKIFPKEWICNKPALLGFYFLCTSGFTMFLFFQPHASPFPPTDSGFPKTETVSLLYTLDILLFLWVLTTKFGSQIAAWIAVVVASIFLIFTRYLLPIFAPNLFMPSMSPFTIIDFFTNFLGKLAWPVFGIAFHLMIFMLAVIFSEMNFSLQEIYVNQKFEQMKRLGILTLFSEHIPFMIFSVIAFFPLFFIEFNSSGKFIFASVLLFLMGVLYANERYFNYRKGFSSVDQLYSSLLLRLKENGINQMRLYFPFIVHFGKWSQDQKGNKIDWLLMDYILTVAVFFGGALIAFYLSME